MRIVSCCRVTPGISPTAVTGASLAATRSIAINVINGINGVDQWGQINGVTDQWQINGVRVIDFDQWGPINGVTINWVEADGMFKN